MKDHMQIPIDYRVIADKYGRQAAMREPDPRMMGEAHDRGDIYIAKHFRVRHDSFGMMAVYELKEAHACPDVDW